MNERARYAMGFFIRKGWTPEQAAGIVGNLMAESSLNPTVKPGDNGTAFGIAQWRNERFTGLKRHAARMGRSWKDLDVQLDYVDYELNNNEARAGRMLRAATSVQAANDAMIMYERPQGSNKGARFAHNYSGRLRFSQQALGQAGIASNYVPEQTSFSEEPGEARPDIQVYEESALGARYPVTNEDRYQQQQNGPQPYDSFAGEVGASFQSYGITSHTLRWLSEGQVDPDFVVGDDRWNMVKELPEQYHAFVAGAGSEANFDSRMKWALEDVERVQRLGQGGWSAVGAGLLAGAIDPVTAIPSILTGGAASAAIGGLSMTGRLLAGSAMGAASNAAFEATSKYAFDDPHADPVMAAGFGAIFGALGGALSRGRATLPEAEMAYEAAAKSAQPGRLSPLPGSAGAARNPQAQDGLVGDTMGYAIDMRDEDVPVAYGGVLRKGDVTGQMTTAKNAFTRLLGSIFFEETAGFKDHSVVPDSVNSRYTALHRQMVGNFNAVYTPAKAAYIAEGNLSRMNLVARARREIEFNREVAAYIRNPHPSPDTNPHIVKAASALQKSLGDFADEMREAGLWKGERNDNYLPLIANHDRIAGLNEMVHADDMHKFIKSAIMRHASEISEDLAGRMAKGYWANLRRAGFGIADNMSKALHLNDKEGFKRAFHEALDDKNLVTDDELSEVFDLLSDMLDNAKEKDGSKGIARLKRRTLLDYNFSADLPTRDGNVIQGFKLTDMFEDDAELVFRRYARTMSGRIAFAKTKIFNPSNGELIMDGIRSEADLEKLKNALRESYRLMPGKYADKKKEMENALENIDFGWKRINGIPVYGSEKNYAQWARRLKQFQFMRLMSNMGLNQIQEAWKIVSLTGFRAAMSQIPAIRAMGRGVQEGVFKKDKLLAELSDMTGIGLDNLWSRYDLRLDDDRIGAQSGGRIGKMLDTALDYGSQLTSNVSFMRQIHDYQQRWAMKAITQQIADMARKARTADGFDFEKIRKADRDKLASIGLGESEAKLLFKNLLDHSEFDGKKIVGVNTAKWDPDALSKFRVFMGRYTDRLVQQNDFGALSKWMSHPIASMFVQFRSFVFGAWAKSTLWSANHALDPKMAVLVLGELAAGVATFIVRQAGQITTDEGREKFWQETMDPVNLVKNGWARTATASVLPMFLDTLTLFTPFDPQFAQARSSGSPTDAWLGSPTVDWLNGIQKSTRSIGKSLWEGEELTQQQMRGLARLGPLGNWVPFTGALGMLIQDMPDN